jgi:hypothetical protein
MGAAADVQPSRVHPRCCGPIVRAGAGPRDFQSLGVCHGRNSGGGMSNRQGAVAPIEVDARVANALGNQLLAAMLPTDRTA